MKNIAQSGRSMIEMLGVLAIIGVLTIGGFSLVNKATTSHKINNVIDDIGALSSKTRMIFREFIYDGGEGSMNEYIANAKAYPETLEPPSDEDTPFVNNDDVKFTVKKVYGEDYFTIIITEIDEETCMAISQTSWGSPSINGYMGMCVGDSCEAGSVVSSTGSNSGGNIAKNGAKISLDDAVTACSGGTDNKVCLTFR